MTCCAGPKEIINRIRREKFFIGAKCPNPLAPDLHSAIKQLSVELYQNDIHFVKEIIQNAEDNTYGENVNPSLEFLLTRTDVANVGASATLVVLNNEIGLREADVIALCSVGRSSKIGKRDRGSIGCKGIGFKSVFMVCETPLIISNGYRIKFRNEASTQAGVGYIVPEWIDTPTDNAIKTVCGRNELPNTAIILPIREAKVELVRKQLKELSPETILFLSRIRELKVVDTTSTEEPMNSGEFLKITRSERVSAITSDVCEYFTVTLSVITSEDITESHSYYIFQRSFPVTHPVQERQEVLEWAITLAFPQQGRPSVGNVGDVFSFLPTEFRSTFPFIINADFILTSSRETIRLDSAWNLGILDCIPAAFDIAFKIMLGRRKYLQAAGITNVSSKHRIAERDAYQYLPCNTDDYGYSSANSNEHRQVRQKLYNQPHQQLEKVRNDILGRFRGDDAMILLSTTIGHGSMGTNYFRNSTSCVQIKPSFRNILESAVQTNVAGPSVIHHLNLYDGTSGTENFAIVDTYVQQKYAAGLAALGIPHMSVAQYKKFLTDSNWILSLPEELYLDFLSFFTLEMKIFEDGTSSSGSYRVFKVRQKNGGVELVSFGEVTRRSDCLFAFSKVEGTEMLYKWMHEISECQGKTVKVMPLETSEALKSRHDLRIWLVTHVSLTELSVEHYSHKLIESLTRDDLSSAYQNIRSKHAILIMQYLYSLVQERLLPLEEIVQRLQNVGEVNVVDKNNVIQSASLKIRMDGGVLLPPAVSKWPVLFDLSRGYTLPANRLVVLSDEYLEPKCSLVKGIVSTLPGPDSMLEFLKEALNASDVPSIKTPVDEGFPFKFPITVEKSGLLLEWLKTRLPNRRKTKREQRNDQLMKSLKDLDWMKTIHHGWQRPTSVFFNASIFSSHFWASDLPFLDHKAYDTLDLDVADCDTKIVFEELGVIHDKRKGSAAVANYLSSLPVENLDLGGAKRFYAYFKEFGLPEDSRNVKIWVPGSQENEGPVWKAREECVLKDEDNVFDGSGIVTVLDKVYDESFLHFFSKKLRVPEKPKLDLYCKIWMKWCRDEVEQGNTRKLFFISEVKVRSVWRHIFSDRKECSGEVWESFLSQAWVPVAPRMATKAKVKSGVNSTLISILPVSEAFIADDLSLSKSFSTIEGGNVNFVWQLPTVSDKQELKAMSELYSTMGVKKLSKFVKSDVSIPASVSKKHIPWGSGLLCEGLLRTILAYLCNCHRKNQISLPLESRHKILSPLISAVEVVVGEPFTTCFYLNTEPCTSTSSFVKPTVAHYAKGKLFCLRRDHATLETEEGKRHFDSQVATAIANGVLSEYPERRVGLGKLLKLLCGSGFAIKSVEYELREKGLVISPNDEKVLMGNLAARDEADTPGQESDSD